jgi:MFS family permease
MPRWYAIYIPYKIGQAIISTIIPMMILSLGGTGSKVGLATMLFSLVSMSFSVVWGTLSDKRELRKPFILMGIGGNILCLMLLSVSTTHMFVIACYALCAILMAAEAPITPVYLLRGSHKSEWDSALGKFNALCGWSWVAGLSLGAIIVSMVSLDVIAVITACIISISFAAALLGMRDVPVYLARPRISIRANHIVERRRFAPNYILHLPRFPRFRNNNNRLFFLATMVLYIGSNLIYLPVIPYLTDQGLENNLIFVVVIANSLGSALVYTKTAALVKTRGCLYPLVTGIMSRMTVTVFLILCVAGIVPYSLIGFCVGFALVGVTWPAIYIPSISFVSHAADDTTRGGLMGKYNFVSTFGLMSGSIFAGYLYDSVAFIASLALAGCLLVIASLIFSRLVREPSSCQML